MEIWSKLKEAQLKIKYLWGVHDTSEGGSGIILGFKTKYVLLDYLRRCRFLKVPVLAEVHVKGFGVVLHGEDTDFVP